MQQKILIITAHPDDEILGCGATVARLIREGAAAYTLILGTGIISRLEAGNKNKQDKINKLKDQSLAANKIIGIKKVYYRDFPDNKFDTVALLDIIKSIEEVKNKIKPKIIFTHYQDLNIDHQITYKAVLTATRPVRGEPTKEIYSFEVPSSTEWNYPLSFYPDVFFNVESTLDIKLRALSKYTGEIRGFPHPRSIEGLRINARQWAMKIGLKYAEAFKVVRLLK